MATRAAAKVTLHLATFLVPSISVEFFEALVWYLEKELKCHVTLLYESRFEGPPTSRADMLIGPRAADIGKLPACLLQPRLDMTDGLTLSPVFLSSHGFLQTSSTHGNQLQLLGLSPEHEYDKDVGRPVVLLDVVVNKNMKGMRSIHELRGCRFVTNSCDRMASSVSLYQLRSMGETASFFSNVLTSRSHLDSIRMILQRKAHAAVVDSNALRMFLRENPNERAELFSIATWGPVAPYVVAVRKDLDKGIRDAVYEVLATMHETPDGRQILGQFKVKRFSAITPLDLQTGQEYVEATKGMSFDVVYY